MLSGSKTKVPYLHLLTIASALASLGSEEHADSASPAASPPTTKSQPIERSKSPLAKDKDEGSTS